MLTQRTDLAMEAKEIWQEGAGKTASLSGVRAVDYRREGWPATRVEILDRRGAEALGKPVGTYVTLDLGGYWDRPPEGFIRAAEALAEELRSLLPEQGPVFVAGLGNAAMTPDALGPQAVSHLLVTRHLGEVLPQLRPVSAAAAGVLGTTGMEAAEWVRALGERVKPSAVIVVDALAARSLNRVCSTIQAADTGIIPGSGVGNRRMALNRETMGVPVISLGVPTVVDAATMALDLLRDSGCRPPDSLGGGNLFVTPKDVDLRVRDLAKIIGYGINLALQPKLGIEDLEGLLA